MCARAQVPRIRVLVSLSLSRGTGSVLRLAFSLTAGFKATIITQVSLCWPGIKEVRPFHLCRYRRVYIRSVFVPTLLVLDTSNISYQTPCEVPSSLEYCSRTIEYVKTAMDRMPNSNSRLRRYFGSDCFLHFLASGRNVW